MLYYGDITFYTILVSMKRHTQEIIFKITIIRNPRDGTCSRMLVKAVMGIIAGILSYRISSKKERQSKW